MGRPLYLATIQKGGASFHKDCRNSGETQRPSKRMGTIQTSREIYFLLTFRDRACTIKSSTTSLGVESRALKKRWFQRQGKDSLPLTPEHPVCEAAFVQRSRLYANTAVLLRRAIAVSLPHFCPFPDSSQPSRYVPQHADTKAQNALHRI
jgi:hypothetical protein